MERFRLIFMRRALPLLCMVLSAEVLAQTPDPGAQRGWDCRFVMRAGRGLLNGKSYFRSVDWDLVLGYDFNERFTLHLPFTASLGLWHRHGEKRYEEAALLGVGAEYNVVRGRNDALGVALTAGSSLGGSWRFAYYDAGLRYDFSGGRVLPYAVAGVRYLQSYRSSYEDFFNFYVGIGLRINAYRPAR